MIEGGQLKVTVRNGKLIIVLVNEVVFDSGKTQLRPAGKTALTAVANALASIKRVACAARRRSPPAKG